MSNAVATKNESKLTVVDQPTKQINEDVLSSDVVLPSVYLMQDTSDFVKQKLKSPDGTRIEAGFFLRSTDKSILGSVEKPLEIIPLTFVNKWRLEEKIGNKFEFRKYEPRNAKNDDLPWDFKQDGADWRRVKVLNLFALLPSDIEAFNQEVKTAMAAGDVPDMNKMVLPVVISFRSTSFASGGKGVATHFAKAQSMAKYGAKAHGFVLKLSARPESNDKGSFYVMDVIQGRKVTKEEMLQAEGWYDQVAIKRDSLKIHDEGDTVEATEIPAGSAQF